MLPFLKKKSEVAALPQIPAWHPNFRNYEKLPDIKVVRTAFFVNGAAAFLTIALAIYFSIQEWNIRAVRLQVADWQAQIDKTKKESELAIATFKKFQVEEAKINEVDAFVRSKPIVSALVERLADTLPANVALDSLDLRENGLNMRISVRGTPAAASQTASNYLELLQKDPELSSRFEKFEFTSTPTRNPSTGKVAVEFFLSLKGAKK